MSNFLSQVTQTASPQTGTRIVIAGLEGVGKTSLIVGAPKPLLIPLEIGFVPKVIPKIPMITTFENVMAFLDEVIDMAQKGKFPHKSLLFDGATALEKLTHNAALEKDPLTKNGNPKGIVMGSALGGYGKGYDYANGLFAKFLEKCDILVEHGGINIIMTSHVFADKIMM